MKSIRRYVISASCALAIAACGSDEGGFTSDGGVPLIDGGASPPIERDGGGNPAPIDAGSSDAGASANDAEAGNTQGPFTIGGTVSGLDGSVTIADLVTTELALGANGAYAFPNAVPNGTSYDVSVVTQPSDQTCVVMNGKGAVAQKNVTDVDVHCGAKLYPLGGSVSAYLQPFTLSDGAEDLAISSAGPFSFKTGLPSGTSYAVTVKSQGNAEQCTVTNGSGTMPAMAVTTIDVACAPTYSVGGGVTGDQGGAVVLQINGAGDVSVPGNATFTLGQQLLDGAPYTVTVKTNPPGQLCTVSSGATGTIAGANVTSVGVTCRALAIAIDEIHARPAISAYGDTNGDGVRDSAQDEFVEILNDEAFDVPLTSLVVRVGATVKYTFGAGVVLASGQRAVVFGGGTPTGSFGGGLAFASGGLSLTDAPATPLAVTLDSMATGGFTLDTTTYDATAFGSSCTTTCASRSRDPGSGAFVAHTTLSGNAGVLWSPGAAPANAVPKLNPLLSQPKSAATNVNVKALLTAQMNMFMNAGDATNANVKLFASPCAALANEVTQFSSFGQGIDASQVKLVPMTDLSFATTYCLSAGTGFHSEAGAPLAAPALLQFATRAAASAPSAHVVISEVGGCRFSGTTGTACGVAGAAGNDEFVELWNPGAAAVDVSGWFIGRRTAAGTASCFATLPAGATIPARGFYLVGGAGYVAAHYTNGATPDFASGGTALTGTNESVLLIDAGGTCTGTTDVVDAMSSGAITDTLAALQLPAFPGTIADGQSLERKACFDTTGDSDATTGLFTGGGHALKGNAEEIGAGNADLVLRASPEPQSTLTAPEIGKCAQ